MESLFSKCSVIVVGDAMVDHYIWGDASRISPEAPVPVVNVHREEYRPGGAANVAANVVGLGGNAELVTFYGRDFAGNILEALAKKYSYGFSRSVALENVKTVRKTRVVARAQQIVRVDWEEKLILEKASESLLWKSLEEKASGSKVLVLSDYGKGMIGDERASRLIQWAKEQNINVVIDPKPPAKNGYRGATVVTPNRKEAEIMSGERIDTLRDAERVALKLRKELELDALVLTLGGDGMMLASEEGSFHYPALEQEVYDVSGAGDTVVACVALSIAAGLDYDVTSRLAMITAGIAVSKVGTAVVHWDDVIKTREWASTSEHIALAKEAKGGGPHVRS